MTHCKDCRYYRSGHWLEGGQQHGGLCPMLTRMLAIANSRLGWIRDDLYVPEAFGCSMGKPTRDDGAGPVEEADNAGGKGPKPPQRFGRNQGA